LEAKKWAVILGFTAVSVLAVAYLVSGSAPEIESMDLGSPAFWITLTVLAVADSVNPCMISVMVLMVATLAAMGLGRKEQVVRAAVFTVAVFVTYLILGILIYYGYTYLYALSVAAGGLNILKTALAGILVIGGLVNIYDAIKGGRAVFSIPEAAKQTIASLMRYVSVVATILLAVFVTVVELPCTGIFYLGLIAYLHSISESIFVILPVLLYYNILFVLPEIIITLFVWKGLDPEIMKDWHKKHRRMLRALEGIVMVVLGVIVYFFVGAG